MNDWLADPAPIVVSWALVAARLTGVLAATPVLGLSALPMTARAGIIVALSAALARPAVAPEPAAWPVALLGELALGAVLGLGIQLAFAAYAAGARLLDVQMGFGIGQVLDPQTRQQLPVLSAAYGRLALVLFVVGDGLHGVLRGLQASFGAVPPGGAWSVGAAMESLAIQVAAQYSLGFALAAPVAVCLLLVELVLGAAARAAPQANVFVLGMPLKIGIGLACLAAWLPAQRGPIARIHETMLAGWQAVFR